MLDLPLYLALTLDLDSLDLVWIEAGLSLDDLN